MIEFKNHWFIPKDFTGVCKTLDDNGIHYYKNGLFHREDGPSNEWGNGDKNWRINNILHREDGPAVELVDGGKSWYLNGLHHREGGPAVELVDGGKSWYYKGKIYGCDNKFTNETWILFVDNLKRKEQLKIFI